MSISDKKLVIIPARGGSKGVPKKNIKPLGGKPLIYYTIEAAREVFEDADIYVSTDSQEIKEVVEKAGLKVPFLRPAELATDTANSRDVILHAIDFYEKENKVKPEMIVLLQPTSPFRNGTHIQEAINLWEEGLDMLVSVKETSSNPYYILFEENDQGYLYKSKKGNFTRRQDCPIVWEYNGAIYLFQTSSVERTPLGEFEKVKKYVMDEGTSVDIDTKFDWAIAELLLKERTTNLKKSKNNE